MNRIIILIALAVSVSVFSGCSSTQTITQDRPADWSGKVNVNSLENLYKVDDNLYRSEQPNASDMKALEQFGMKTVLNLRRVQDDNREARNTSLKLHHIPINTFKMSYEELLQSVRIIEKAEKPVLVHCLHGSDRTGVVVAAYRMTTQGWTKEAAIKEFKEGGYGYHDGWFPNLVELLESLDVQKLKTDLSAAD